MRRRQDPFAQNPKSITQVGLNVLRATSVLTVNVRLQPRRLMISTAVGCSRRHSIEELNDAGLQRILAADDEESIRVDQLLEDFGPVA